MTKYFRLLVCVVAFAFATSSLMAQAPYMFSYQAAVRNAAGQPVSIQTVGVKISILQGSESGTAVYVETQKPRTNMNGVFNVIVGGNEATVVSGDIAAIDWYKAGNSFFLQSEIDIDGDDQYELSYTEKLIAVPYALYARHTSDGIKEVIENDNCADMMQIKCIGEPTEDYDLVTKVYLDSVVRKVVEKMQELAEEEDGGGNDDCDITVSTKLINYEGTYHDEAVSKRGTTVTVDPGSSLTLTGEATSDEGTLSYEWSTSPFFETVLATGDSYTLTAGEEGSVIYYFRAKATTSDGCTDKSTKSITVNFGEPPVDCGTMIPPILAGPSSICMGSSAKLYVSNPQEDYTYEFFKDGESIGEGTSKLVSEKGDYYVVATWANCDEKKSNTLSLDKLMSISTPSISVISTDGTSAVVKVSSGGSLNTVATIAVYKGNTFVTGGTVSIPSTSKEVTITGLSPNTTYTAYVSVTKEGSCESDFAQVSLTTANDCPVPNELTIVLGGQSQNITLTPEVRPAGNYTYHWYISTTNGGSSDQCSDKLYFSDGSISPKWSDQTTYFLRNARSKVASVNSTGVNFDATNTLWTAPNLRQSYGSKFNRTIKVVITSSNPGCVEGKNSVVFCSGKFNFVSGSPVRTTRSY